MRGRRLIAATLLAVILVPGLVRRRPSAATLQIPVVRTRATYHGATPMPVTTSPTLRPLLPWWSVFHVAALDTGIPASLLRAIAIVESHGNPKAQSGAGAVGLMQLEPAAATQEGVASRRNPVASIFGAAQYLRWLASAVQVGATCWATAPGGTAACAWEIDRVLSAYNAGLGGHMQWGYIQKVRGVWVQAAS